MTSVIAKPSGLAIMQVVMTGAGIHLGITAVLDGMEVGMIPGTTVPGMVAGTILGIMIPGFMAGMVPTITIVTIIMAAEVADTMPIEMGIRAPSTAIVLQEAATIAAYLLLVPDALAA